MSIFKNINSVPYKFANVGISEGDATEWLDISEYVEFYDVSSLHKNTFTLNSAHLHCFGRISIVQFGVTVKAFSVTPDQYKTSIDLFKLTDLDEFQPVGVGVGYCVFAGISGDNNSAIAPLMINAINAGKVKACLVADSGTFLKSNTSTRVEQIYGRIIFLNSKK